ncbi:MAG: DUF4327 family protein [Microcystaceae cyanobacterium]
MSVSTLPSPTPSANILYYSINIIKDEVRQLVERGTVSRRQPIYVLCQHIPPREWVYVECELERCDYLLRDQIGDLIAAEAWDND